MTNSFSIPIVVKRADLLALNELVLESARHFIATMQLLNCDAATIRSTIDKCLLEMEGGNAAINNIQNDGVSNREEFSDGPVGTLENIDADDSFYENAPQRIEAEFSNTPLFRTLERIKARYMASRNSEHGGVPQDFEKLRDLALSGLDAFVQARRWFKARCEQDAISFIECHDDWIVSSTDQELDREDSDYLFADRGALIYQFNWDDIQQIATELLDALRFDEFSQIAEAVTKHLADLPPSAIQNIDSMLKTGAFFETFLEIVKNRLADGPVARTTLVDEIHAAFHSELDNDGIEMACSLENWLAVLNEEGQIEVAKIRGRYQVFLPS